MRRDYGVPLYGWGSQPRATTVTVHEREPEAKPVLYDHRGQPLVKARQRLGFQPPEKRK